MVAGTTYETPGRTQEATIVAGAVNDTGEAVSSFGEGGLSPRFDFPGAGAAQARAIVEVAERKVVLGGYVVAEGKLRFALARLDANGRLDPTFGSGGVVVTDVPGADEPVPAEGPDLPERTTIADLAVQADGKLLAVGTAYNSRARSGRVAVARYLTDGRLDPDFGAGTGVVTFAFPGRRVSEGRSVALQSRAGGGQDILVGGEGGSVPQSSVSDSGLARLLNDGRRDRTFGRSGTAVTALGWNGAEDIAIVSGGLFIAAGGMTRGVFVQRYDRNGRLRASWGAAGSACTEPPGKPGLDFPSRTHLIPLPAGKVLLGATSLDPMTWVFARYRAAFRADIDCFSVDVISANSGMVGFALARPGRLSVAVYRGRTFLGRVSFGMRQRGAQRAKWNLRVGSHRVRFVANYRFVPRLSDP